MFHLIDRGSCLVIGVLAVALSAPSQVAPHGTACLEFDGLDDFAFVARSPSLEPSEITIELWAKLDGEQTWNTRLVRKAAHFGSGYFLSADQDNNRAMHLRVQNDQSVVVAEDPAHHSVYDGEWHHFAGVYRLESADFLVDGVLVHRVWHKMGAMEHDPLIALYIGAGLPSPSASEYFKGRMDEVRIWNYPRRPQQIQHDMGISLSGAQPGLVANWTFDEGEGQLAFDSSRGRNDARLGTGPGPDASDPTWVRDNAPVRHQPK